MWRRVAIGQRGRPTLQRQANPVVGFLSMLVAVVLLVCTAVVIYFIRRAPTIESPGDEDPGDDTGE